MKIYMNEMNLNTLEHVSGGDYRCTEYKDYVKKTLKRERERRADFERRAKEMQDLAASRVQAGEEAIKEAMKINCENRSAERI